MSTPQRLFFIHGRKYEHEVLIRQLTMMERSREDSVLLPISIKLQSTGKSQHITQQEKYVRQTALPAKRKCQCQEQRQKVLGNYTVGAD